MENLNAVGQQFFNIVINCSYWFIVISTAVDILKSFSSRNSEGAIKSLIGGTIGFACVHLITTCLDIIKGCF